MKQPTLLCSCITCKKQTSDLGITTHFLRSHGSVEQKQLFANNYMSSVSKNAKEKYDQHPKLCKGCNKIIDYKDRVNKFCSHSCAGSYSNKQRKKNGWALSANQKLSISKTLIKHNAAVGNRPKSLHETIKTASGGFSRVHFMKCKFCNDMFTAGTATQVCNNCQHLKWNNNKDQYSFKFNIFDYPNLFDLEMLQQIGWVAFGGKRGGNKNRNGLSRDHKISVNDAKKFSYDPYYISHPLNCELMPHIQNNKKKSKSSISYRELVKLVDDFDGSSNENLTRATCATNTGANTTPYSTLK